MAEIYHPRPGVEREQRFTTPVIREPQGHQREVQNAKPLGPPLAPVLPIDPIRVDKPSDFFRPRFKEPEEAGQYQQPLVPRPPSALMSPVQTIWGQLRNAHADQARRLRSIREQTRIRMETRGVRPSSDPASNRIANRF